MSPKAKVQPPRMRVVGGNIRRISLRPRPFKAALAGLGLAILLFAVGFTTPAWVGHRGLWWECSWNEWSSVCTYTGLRMILGWQEATKILETVALVLLLLAVVVELYQDFRRSPTSPDNRAVEIVASLGSLIGLMGVFVFGSEAKRYFDSQPNYYYPPISTGPNLRWALWLTATGCVLALVSSLVLTISRSHYYQLMSSQAAESSAQREGLLDETAAAAMASSTGCATSQVPVCFVMVQGQAVPVFDDDVTMKSSHPGMTPGSVKVEIEGNVDAKADPPAYRM